MGMPYTDDEIEEDENTLLEDFEIEGVALGLDIADSDLAIRDGDIKTIDGETALKQWIEKAFKTRAHIYEIYDEEATDEEDVTEYGSEALDILLDPNADREEKMADIQLDIENVLGRHPDIISVSDFEFEQIGRSLTVDFTVNSIYGDLQEEVILNGSDSE